MAYCTNCGHPLVDGAKFCSECGAKATALTALHDEQRKTVYEGEIHKCPNCGDILDAYEPVCETCGWERRGTKASAAVKEFEEKFLSAETSEKKIDLIKTFAVPNTQEDIQEFMILAIANIGTYTTGETQLANAWIAKYEQVYQKAELLWGKTHKLQDMQVKFLTAAKRIKKVKRKDSIIVAGSIVFAVLFFGGIFGGTFGGMYAERKEIAAENARLESILEEVNTYIANEAYSEARGKATQLIFTYSGFYNQQYDDDVENWNKIRQEILDLIEQAERAK